MQWGMGTGDCGMGKGWGEDGMRGGEGVSNLLSLQQTCAPKQKMGLGTF